MLPSRLTALFAALLFIACGDREPVAIEVDPRWSIGVPLPIGLTDVAAGVHNGAIIVAGGESADGPSAHVYRLAPGAVAWQRLSDLPEARVDGRLVVSDGTLYLLGGTLVIDGVHFTDRRLLMYVPAEDRWVERAPLPDLRSGDAVGVPGGVVVVGGGFGSPEHGGVFPGDSAAVYDATANSWRYAAPITTPRSQPLAVAIGSEVHVFGGQQLDGAGTVRDIEVYDAANDTWRTGGRFVDYGLIVGQAYAGNGNAVHFFGGVYAQPGAAMIETHFLYDIASETWDVLPPLPTPRAHAAAVVLDGRIHVIGGLHGPRFNAESFVAAVDIFDVR